MIKSCLGAVDGIQKAKFVRSERFDVIKIHQMGEERLKNSYALRVQSEKICDDSLD